MAASMGEIGIMGDCSAAGNVTQALTRTQLRRAQRAHTLQCLKAGSLYRAKHLHEVEAHLAMLLSGEVYELTRSVAIHRSDCAVLSKPYHFAATSNLNAAAAGFKSKQTFIEHRQAHKSANKVKHDTTPAQHLTTPAFAPFSGTSWNLLAEEFTPGQPSHGCNIVRPIESAIPGTAFPASETHGLGNTIPDAHDQLSSLRFTLTELDFLASDFPCNDALRPITDEGLPVVLFEDGATLNHLQPNFTPDQIEVLAERYLLNMETGEPLAPSQVHTAQRHGILLMEQAEASTFRNAKVRTQLEVDSDSDEEPINMEACMNMLD